MGTSRPGTQSEGVHGIDYDWFSAPHIKIIKSLFSNIISFEHKRKLEV
jgi:hypothetical protein